MRFSISVLGLMLGLGIPAFAGETKADLDLKQLTQRAGKETGTVEQLRQEIFAFRQAYPGTPQAVVASGLLRDLPSLLDKYDPNNIHSLDLFAWQPKELVAVFGEHRGRQGGAVTSVVYSRNGKMLVSGSTNGYVRFWDPTTMRQLYRFQQPGGNYALAFNKENTLLAGAGGDGNVIFWDVSVEPPKQKETFKASATALHCLALAPNGKTLAVGTAEPKVSLWDLTESPPREISTGDTHSKTIHGIAFAPDGKTLATGSMDKTLRLWTVKDNKLKEKAVSEPHPGGVLAVAYHPTDEKVLVTGGSDGTIGIWNIGAKPVAKSVFKNAGGGVHAVAFSLSGKTLATGHGDGICRTWSIGAAIQEKSHLEGHINQASSIAFSPDGTTITSGSHDWTVRQWPAVSGPKPRDKTVLTGHLSPVHRMNFAPDGQSLASGSNDRTIRIWDLSASQAKEKMLPIKADVYQLGVAFAPDGKSLAGYGAGNTFRTYDAATRRILFIFKGHSGQITSVSYSPDGSLLVTSAIDKTVRLWNPKTGQVIDSITVFETPVSSAALSSDNKYVLTANGAPVLDPKGQQVVKNGIPLYMNNMVRIFEVADKQEIFRWKDEKLLPNAVSFAPDGRQFLIGASDNWLRTWSWPEPQPVDPAILYKGSNAANQLSFSPDGRYLAVRADGGYAILDRATGKRLRHWVFPENLGHIAFAPDSRHLTIALATGVIYLLRLEEAGKK